MNADDSMLARYFLLFIGVMVATVLIFSYFKYDMTVVVCDELTYQDGINDALDKVESCEMRFAKYNISTEKGVHGVYSHPEYFCVWTKDREPRDIAQTTFHELAHYYSYRDSEHFCDTDYITKKVCKED